MANTAVRPSETGVPKATPRHPSAPVRPATKPSGTVKADLARISDSSRPWWAEAPDVAWKCALVAVAPFRALAMALEMAVSAAFVAVFGAAALWWVGYIPDETVAAVLADVGGRVLAVLRETGAF